MRGYRALLASLLITNLTAVGQVAIGATGSYIDPSCKAKPVIDPRVKGRANAVTFPDGRVLTIVGHIHGTRQIYRLNELVTTGKLAKMSDQQLEAKLKSILAENHEPYKGLALKENVDAFIAELKKSTGFDASAYFNRAAGHDLTDATVLAHAKQDYEYLKDQVSKPQSRSKIQFVGWEGSEQRRRKNIGHIQLTRQALLRELAIRKQRGAINLSNNQIHDAIFSSINANAYMYVEYPGLQQVVPLVGVENEEAGSTYDETDPLDGIRVALNEMDEADQAYWKSRPKTPEEQARAAGFRKDPKALLFMSLVMSMKNEVESMNVQSIQEFEKKVKFLRSLVYPWMARSFENVIVAFRKRIEVNLNRDAASAWNLAGRFQSGVHFVGLNHLQTTVSMLEQHCTTEMKALGHQPVYGATETKSFERKTIYGTTAR